MDDQENERQVDEVIINAIDVELRNIRNFVEVLQYGDLEPQRREIHFAPDGEVGNENIENEHEDYVIIPVEPPVARTRARPPLPIVFTRDHPFQLSVYVRNAARSIQLLSQHYHRLSRDDLVHIFQSMYDASSTLDRILIRMNIDPRDVQ